MNNRSIAWWLKQIGLPQYTKSLEGEYYGLEGLLYVCDVDLKEAGVDDPSHRDTILSQLLRHRQTLDPHSGMVEELRVSRKYSLGSSLDLVKPRKDLFRQSVLPRLRRKVTVSASCSQLHPLEEGLSPGLAPEQTRKRSKRRSVTAYLSQLKVFGGSREMDSLKKELEEELKLSTDDLRSHAWYHGPVGREVHTHTHTSGTKTGHPSGTIDLYTERYTHHLVPWTRRQRGYSRELSSLKGIGAFHGVDVILSPRPLAP
ncbi:uncharacterized protein LOC127928031 [Oncorhynchus keta]|uniref:uncharacterized protein LOC127928031 n=1 Tax=Oncorhynchus keta TaxID=8018 RepID=UPI00227AF10F|nr:uncharacterized protein LOC127928031 [Oncorhynchus keta]